MIRVAIIYWMVWDVSVNGSQDQDKQCQAICPPWNRWMRIYAASCSYSQCGSLLPLYVFPDSCDITQYHNRATQMYPCFLHIRSLLIVYLSLWQVLVSWIWNCVIPIYTTLLLFGTENNFKWLYDVGGATPKQFHKRYRDLLTYVQLTNQKLLY